MAYVYVPYVGPIVTLREAVERGLPRYFLGRPCKHGHLSDRYTSNANCVACLNVVIARDRNKERFLELAAVWREANKERIRTVAKARLKENPVRDRPATKAWLEANKDKIKAQHTALRMANPLRWKCYAENRRARKLAAGGTHTPAQIAALAVAQKHKCPGCGVSIKAGFEADHIVALSKGGGNDISNIQLLCKPCNRSKHNKDPIDWARANGRLL